MKKLFYIVAVALTTTDGVFTMLPFIKAELRRQPSEGKNAYKFSLDIETDIFKTNDTNEKKIQRVKINEDDTKPDTKKRDEGQVKNKTYIKFGNSRLIITDTTDEEKIKDRKYKKIILKRKQKAKYLSKSDRSDEEDNQKEKKRQRKRFKIIKQPDETVNEDEHKSNEGSATDTHIDKWISGAVTQEETDSEQASESLEFKKTPVKRKAKPKRGKRVKRKPFKLYQIKIKKKQVKPKIVKRGRNPIKGYQSTRQGVMMDNYSSDNEGYGEALNRAVMDTNRYVPTRKMMKDEPLWFPQVVGRGDMVTDTSHFTQSIRSETTQTTQSQDNPNGMINNPSFNFENQYQVMGTGNIDLINITSPRAFTISSTMKSTTEEFKVDFQNILRKVAESQIIDNITNILVDKMYSKMSTKKTDDDIPEESVEKIEIALDPTYPEINQKAKPNVRLLRRFRNVKRNKAYFIV